MAEEAKGRIGILISGRGSNMEAIAEACKNGDVPAEVAVVISSEPDADGLEKTRKRRLESMVIDHRNFGEREEHEKRIHSALTTKKVDLVCLAGYMRVLSPWFIHEWRGRVMNIHPSLLPAFPGLEAQEKAFDYGVRMTGCTVHLVDERVDHGPIVVQEALDVLDDDSVESLTGRILEIEHKCYVEAIRHFYSGKMRVVGRRVFLEG